MLKPPGSQPTAHSKCGLFSDAMPLITSGSGYKAPAPDMAYTTPARWRRPSEVEPEAVPENIVLLANSVGSVLIRAADCGAKSAQAPRPYRQALDKTIWRGSDRVAAIAEWQLGLRLVGGN